jgi:hypothetical protein
MTPHYLRFARAVALVGSIGGVGCGMATTPDADTGPGSPDAAATGDAGTDAAVATVDANQPDAYRDCSTCSCGLIADDAGLPSCDPVCCVAVGPLAPPDLAA